jgi:thioredoxin:protein disulfide reductase
MKKFLALILFCAPAALAQFDAPVVPPEIKVGGSVAKRAGDQVEGTITVAIPATWHVQSNKPLDAFAIPTVLTLDPATADLVSAQYPQHKIETFAFNSGQKVAVYDGTLQIPFVAKLKPNATTITAKLHYQACNDKVCLPPKDATGTFDVNGGQAPPPISSADRRGRLSSNGFVPLSSAPHDAKSLSDDKLASTFATSGLPLTLLVLFALGMALNLTPCVFPMIPITVGFFAMQSDGRRARRFALSAFYVLGIVIMYSSLGVVASLGGKMFGAVLQQPAVQIGLAGLMLVLASSMFGAFDIGVPQFIANRAMGRAGFAGATTMGLIVGIVAAPCVGPVVVSLIALVASIGKPLIGFVMFAALALGLGFPYLVMLNALPRPGEWMVQVKKAMGFVLVAMAFYFLRPLAGEAIFRYGVAASLLIGAAFLFFMATRGPQARALRIACASLLLVGGVAFALPPAQGAELSWEHYDAGMLAAAKQPVMIDFYATWCLPCKELDVRTFSDSRVADELKRFRRVKADLTLPDDPKTLALTKQYAIVGVPTIIFIDANGNERRDLRLTGFEPPEQFLARAKQVR